MSDALPALHSKSLRRHGMAALLIATLFFTLVPPGPVLSASYEVTNTNDSGAGSLRDAIGMANTSVGVADTITFNTDGWSLPHTITLTTGEIEILDDLTIIGAGAETLSLTVSANQLSRVFNISNNATVYISGLTIADGLSDDGSGGQCGTNGEDGGGILAASGTQLTLTDCVLENNATGNGGAAGGACLCGNGGNGGAIASFGTLTLDDCTFHNNHTGNGGPSQYLNGGNGGNGGALWVDGLASIDGCQFDGNFTGTGGASAEGGQTCGNGGHGGACYIVCSTCSISSCTFSSNAAGDGSDGGPADSGDGGNGGALCLEGGDFEILRCTVDDNQAGDGGMVAAGSGYGGYGGCGGGVAAMDGTSIELRDCSLTNNTAGNSGSHQTSHVGASGGRGGGLYSQGTILLDSCLVAQNRAGNGGGTPSAGGGDGGYGGGLSCSGDGVAVTALRTTIRDNDAGNGGVGSFAQWAGDGGAGGGIACSGPLTMEACTISGNHVGAGGFPYGTDGSGGGIGLFGDPFVEAPPSTLVNCTIAENVGPSNGQYGGEGGGGLIIGEAECHLSNCTISGNTAVQGGGVMVEPSIALEDEPEPGQAPVPLPTLLLKNCIVAGNSADVAPDILDETWYGYDLEGGTMSYGCNLIGDDEGFSLVYESGAPDDIIGADPMLESLDDNGGPTETMALESRSPAIDAVESGHCRTIDGDTLDEDQRGEARPTDGDGDGTALCDTGAYEAKGIARIKEKEVEEEHEPRPLAPASMSTAYMALGTYQALPGQQVQVSVNVCNSGEVKGSQSVALSVNGVSEQSQTVAVSGGSCKTVVFIVAKSVPGTYDIDVNGMHGQLTVLAPRTVQASVPSSQSTGVGTAGIIAIMAVMIVLVIGLVVVFRQS